MNEPREYGKNIRLPSLDDLFSTQEQRDDAALEKVQILPLTELHPFTNHPYSVRDDEEMQKMADSIRDYGVMVPAIARPRAGGGYELISGHRRKHGCELAGVTEMPVLVREMDDDTAIILMVDSNVQRENVLPSEKAKAYQMKLEAIKRKGGRPSKINSDQLGQNFSGTFSVEKVADDSGESKTQVQRYIRLNSLIPELQDMVDEKKLKMTPAVQLSYLTPDEQRQFYDYIDSESCTPSLSQAQKLKAASQAKALTAEKLQAIMTAQPPSVKPREQQISLPLAQIEKYFPQNFTAEQIAARILKMLEAQYRSRQQRGMER